MRGRLYLHARRSLIGLTKKRAFAQTQSVLAGKTRSYPASIYLPWGTYTANGVPFDHKRGDETQVTAPFPRLAVLRPPRDPDSLEIVEAFLGAVGGRVEIFDSDDRDRLRAVAADLLRNPPELIFAVGEEAAKAARSRLSALPLIYARVAPTVDLGIDPAADRVFGVARRASPKDVIGRLIRVAPKVKRLGLIYDPDRSSSRASEAVDAARELGVEVSRAKVRDAGDVQDALERLSDVDGYWVFDDPVLGRPAVFEPIVKHAMAGNLPVVCGRYDLVRSGALMSIEPDPRAEGVAAAKVGRALLWGRSPPETGRIQATGVRWTLNRKIAIMLGLDLPYAAIRDAWRVVNIPPPENVTGE